MTVTLLQVAIEEPGGPRHVQARVQQEASGRVGRGRGLCCAFRKLGAVLAAPWAVPAPLRHPQRLAWRVDSAPPNQAVNLNPEKGGGNRRRQRELLDTVTSSQPRSSYQYAAPVIESRAKI